MMKKAIKNMNKEELIEDFYDLSDLQEKLKELYEKKFGNEIGKEITNDDEIKLFNRIKKNLYYILLAKIHINERLASEFKTFIM